MLKPLIRLTLAHLIWRHYKPVLIATVVCLLGIILVSFLHADYVAFAKELQGENHLGLSFIVKWLVYCVIVGLWLWIWLRTMAQRQKLQDINTMLVAEKNYACPEDDPFNNIRHKDKLNSKADAILNKS
ncbi:hypothetical protein QX776_08010 [Alteromonadaceae bacterium BrNp21-10]|nr:hypothetical protein [Alteromonadaceae bacterium BrNp21-10]